ncbi:hypothetical protein BH23PLA1_BH23PLA1_03170 [soil metagenome]
MQFMDRLRRSGLVLGLAWLPASVSASTSPQGGEPLPVEARSAADWLDHFRAGWEATEEHMRPLDGQGWKVRMEVLRGLARLGGEAVQPLIAAMDDDDAEIRVLSAQALSYLADPRAIDRLKRTLAEDPAPAARLYAADALGAAGGLKPSPLLEQVERQDENRDVRAHVRFALERQGQPLDPQIQEQLKSIDLDRLDSAEVGKLAPDFQLNDALGHAYQLSQFRDKQAVVLVFIYGDT